MKRLIVDPAKKLESEGGDTVGRYGNGVKTGWGQSQHDMGMRAKELQVYHVSERRTAFNERTRHIQKWRGMQGKSDEEQSTKNRRKIWDSDFVFSDFFGGRGK